MSRRNTLLAVLAAVLLVALAWVLLYQPRNDEIAEIRTEIAAQEAREAELATRIAELELVRETAPETEAELVTASTVIPRAPDLPSVLSQLQLAADEAGVELLAMAPSRPEPVAIEGGEEGLSRINLVVDAEGTYFELVDFLRRVEDPAISPRGVLWQAATLEGEYDDYPTLTISLQGDLFAILPVVAEEPEAPAAADPEADPEAVDGADPDADPDADADEDPGDTDADAEGTDPDEDAEVEG